MEAHAQKKFATTIIMPSCTYGPGNSLIDNLEGAPSPGTAFANDLPVLCSADGLACGWPRTATMSASVRLRRDESKDVRPVI